MRIVFFGTAEFGEPSLRALSAEHEIAAVVTACDAPRGRGRRIAPPPIKVVAEELGLPVMQPCDLMASTFADELRALDADLYYVVAFRILPRSVFDIPPLGTVNLHGSLLPDYRGAAPVNRAVINGDEITGLTTFFINERVDTGDMILQEETPIGPNETAGELYERLKELGAGLTLRTVELIERGGYTPKPQPEGQSRPAPKLFREDGRIDWTADARTVHNFIRGMTPVPGAFTDCKQGAMKIRRTEVVEETSAGDPGLIIGCSTDEGLVVACGQGSLRIAEMQPPGKRTITSGSFVCGYQVEAHMHITDLC